MSDDIDRNDFRKAMQAAGVGPSGDVTAEEWLRVWEGYGRRRMDSFKAFVSGIADLVTALRDKLLGHVEREAAAKASLRELTYLRWDALELGAKDVVIDLARQRGRLEHMAEYAAFDAEAVRKSAANLGIDLKENDQ